MNHSIKLFIAHLICLLLLSACSNQHNENLTREEVHKIAREEIILSQSLGFIPMPEEAAMINRSPRAHASQLQAMLQTLRSTLELYKSQHHDTLPTLAQLQDHWKPLTVKTGDFGPYLLSPPLNPFTGLSTIGSKPDKNTAWIYNESTGALFAVVPNSLLTNIHLPDSDAVPCSD